jgi:hypothetical protein
MKQRLIAIIVFLTFPCVTVANQCTDNFSDVALQTFKQKNFVVEESEQRNKVAIKLLSCLGSSDPKVRDGIVYEATSAWLRGDLLDQTTIKTMFDFLINTSKQTEQDLLNFTQPFAVLVLSEVLRVDRITPYLMDKER